jgi:hypothetical protein
MASLRRGLAHIGVTASLLIALSSGMGPAHGAGALAVGTCGAYGVAFDHHEPKAASAAALGKCTGNCQLASLLQGNCAALAIDGHDACRAFGYAAAPALAQAQNAALQSCYRYGGKDCVIRAFVCDGSKG